MIRRLLALVTTVVVLAGSASAPSVVMAGGPPAGSPIPPLRSDGPVVLPSGRVLPVRPAGVHESSVQAEMLAAHAGDKITFAPGERPRARGAGAILGLATGNAPPILPLSLADPSSASATLAILGALPNGMRKEVLGFLPYWMLNAGSLQWMQYQLVTTIAYFGVGARSDGTLATTSGSVSTAGWGGWNSSAMTGVINAAHARNVRVVLTITMMATDGGVAQAALLGSSTARAALVNAIAATVRDRSADGVNLDFEPVSTTLRDQYTSFVRQLKAGLVGAGVGSYLTVCTMAGAGTWSTGYDLAGLTATGAADALFVMGYDYSWSGSARAGGVAPMSSPYILDVAQSVNDYLAIVPGAKIIWGVPYYGRTWQTTTGDPNAPTRSGASGASKAYYYVGARNLATTYGRRWDDVGKVPWFAYYDTPNATWVEGYYDDAVSLAAKYDMINQKNLAGAGMWTLLMDQGDSALWSLIANKFVNDTTPPIGGIRILPAQADELAAAVAWAATDVGSGVKSYSVQVRDVATSTWTPWLTATNATTGFYPGLPGHSYEFRVAAVDFKGNAQPWLAATVAPGATLAIGGFAQVGADSLNVRSGAGTAFPILGQLSAGNLVALMAGPVAAGGYQWYQVQYAFTEWPSAAYPRLGWVAAGSVGSAWLTPSKAPGVVTMAPSITGYNVAPRQISPNGDGVLDSATVTFTLPGSATGARLEVLAATGAVVDATDLGPLGPGVQSATWDGRLASGGSATAGSYLLRISATDGLGTHLAPATGVDAGLISRWGVTVDLTAPTAGTLSPSGTDLATSAAVGATFSEPVSGVNGATLRLVDRATSAAVAGSVAYDPATLHATFVPTSRLAAGHAYRAMLDPAVRDTAGNQLAPISWTFATEPLVAAYAPTRMLTFLAGTYTGYAFDSTGRVTASRTATLARTSGAPTSQRSAAIPGQPGAWFQVTAGIWAGYWVRESPKIYLPGIASQMTLSPVGLAMFGSGTYTGYRFDAAGRVTATKVAALPRPSAASAGATGIINGQPYLAIVTGIWAGYWVPKSGSVVLH